MKQMRSLFIFCALILLCFSSCGPKLPDPGPLPPGKSFSGNWDSNWGQIHLIHHGNRVSGSYKGFRNGSLSGEANGDLFTFYWTQKESRQSGRGYLQMNPDGERLEGRWGYEKNHVNGGRWWATRVGN
jgi:hypothetical protein